MEHLKYGEIKHHTCFMYIVLNSKIDIEYFLQNIAQNLDVEVSEDKLYVYQKNNKKIINKSLGLCTTRTRNKLITSDGQGYTNVSFAYTNKCMKFTYPPEYIPLGTYCSICKEKGPYAHKKECGLPLKSSLYLTFSGLFRYCETLEYSKNIKDISNTLDELLQLEKDCSEIELLALFCKIIHQFCYIKTKTEGLQINSTSPKKEYQWNNKIALDILYYMKKNNIFHLFFNVNDIIKINKILNSELNIDYIENDQTLSTELKNLITNIPVLMSINKKNSKGFYQKHIILTYKLTDIDKSITIRLNEEGIMTIIANPINKLDFYKEVIEYLNRITHSKLFVKEKQIKTLFSTVSLLKDPFSKELNLKEFNNLLNSGDKIITSLSPLKIKYCYENTLDLNYSRIYISFINYIFNFLGNYKILVQLFAQGHVQFSFCFVSKDYVPFLFNINCIKTHIKIIRDILIDLLIGKIKNFNNCENLIKDSVMKKISDKIYPTILGILPYAKRKIYRINDIVNVFNDNTMEWSQQSGKIIDIRKTLINNQIEDNIYFVKGLLSDPEKISYLTYRNIRRIDPTNDQVCRCKKNDIPYCPIPYSFYGNCPGGYSQFIHPYGTISRSDNRYYPYIEDLNEELYNWVLNILYNGPSEEDKYFYFLFSEIDMDSISLRHIRLSNSSNSSNSKSYHSYTGTFKIGTVDIGSSVYLLDGRNVKILSKTKTHGLGNDNNKVYYKVINDNNDEFNEDIENQEEIFEILGSDIDESYIEKRYFPGINNILSKEEFKEYLISLYLEEEVVFPLINKNNYKNIIDNSEYILLIPNDVPFKNHNILNNYSKYIYKIKEQNGLEIIKKNYNNHNHKLFLISNNIIYTHNNKINNTFICLNILDIKNNIIYIGTPENSNILLEINIQTISPNNYFGHNNILNDIYNCQKCQKCIKCHIYSTRTGGINIIGKFISFKFNFIDNNKLHPYLPIYDPFLTTKENYLGLENTMTLYNNIFNNLSYKELINSI